MTADPGGSGAMHLFHVPTKAEAEDNLSACHICLRKGPLSEEHVPPKSAFNNCNKLWDRLVLSSGGQMAWPTKIRGGFRVPTLCSGCNKGLCAPYAEEYVKLVRHIVQYPKLFDPSGEARVVSVQMNTLLIAKEIATMILAVEPLGFAKHHGGLRQFVLDRTMLIDPPLDVFAFLVPEVAQAGTISRFRGTVDTFAPGFELQGGEISWPPFGFVYAATIGPRYRADKLTNINEWFSRPAQKDGTVLRLHCRLTGFDSINCMLGNQRLRPQMENIGQQYATSQKRG